MYYGIVCIAVVLFGFQFYCNDRFQKQNGDSMASAMLFLFLSALAGSVVLTAINGFHLTVTPFNALMAVVDTIDGLLFTLCSMKALGKINLSVYSIFSMLGGMTLPFVIGICFSNEPLTLGKGICFALVAISLLFTKQKEDGGSGRLYYAGVFVLNGMSGVIAKVFNDAPYPKGTAADFSDLTALITMVTAFVWYCACRKKLNRISFPSILDGLGAGAFCRFANYLLLIALVVLPASSQYPFITGGVMIVSTLLCLFTPNKPKKNDYIAVALSFAGIVALVILP